MARPRPPLTRSESRNRLDFAGDLRWERMFSFASSHSFVFVGFFLEEDQQRRRGRWFLRIPRVVWFAPSGRCLRDDKGAFQRRGVSLRVREHVFCALVVHLVDVSDPSSKEKEDTSVLLGNRLKGNSETRPDRSKGGEGKRPSFGTHGA